MKVPSRKFSVVWFLNSFKHLDPSTMSFMRMALRWILILSFKIIFSAQAADFNRPSFVSMKSGERVTLNCTFQDEYSKELIVWYKQTFGELPQEVGKITANIDIEMSAEFRSGFKIEKSVNGISLTILQTKKSDEGLYFCGIYTWGNSAISSGTFIAVTGKPDLNVSVFQSGVSDSVPAGASVTLQCSVLSESRSAELQVLWFRAAPPQSHPQIIYTHHNSSHQCESGSSTHTCVYNFSKNILSLSDTGTYYCAVAVCGKIIFGNGTRVQLAMNTFTDQHHKGSDSVVISLAVALAVCVVVIFAQAILNCKKQNSVKLPQGALKVNQARDAVEMNYAALNFSERKTKSGRPKKRQPQDTVYSEVIHTPVT
ncbi:uncharacterized protein LOC108268719 [Ictalurus punctatus]|uniref:Uncharacterized protein LOC108268719 n=1 Tax=Ictalurus punctatus TaxID=7998 RepID=A0A2D0RHF3_ICTPU|nr:uncharacterized protein LOC108268719 [Ictalurus punctatus]